ncbi:bifunctional DNA primase/polymerase [Streptomyces sp. TR02-1]|uniref:bifunctional DNA primase/polymerase n=1 Tax=Streptomyces sp. TR02-1 TaxID=3385977 RepID=UPI0039A321A0
MGFSIGVLGSGLRERRGARDLRPGARRRSRTPEGTAVAEYTGLWGWDVAPGARVVRSGGRTRCSCGTAACPTPGAHPLPGGARVPAGAALDEACRAWARTPGATMLLPAGRHFDVLEVSEQSGRRALARLERMGLPLGPVAAAPHGRCWFLVAPGAADAMPALLYRTGWDDTGLDLRCLGAGAHITAPPSDHAGLGPVRWVRPPGLGQAPVLPEARLLLGTLAYVSHRSAALRLPSGG